MDHPRGAARDPSHRVLRHRPASQLDVLAAAVAELQRVERESAEAKALAVRAEERSTVVEARLDAIEGRHDWYAALGYAKTRGLPTDTVSLQRLGAAAGQVGRQAGLVPNRVQHALYGAVNQWPAWVWDQAAGPLG